MTKLFRTATKCTSPLPRRCSFSLEQVVYAPLPMVWSIVRQFHNPQAYKPFIKSCSVGGPTLRMINHVTGFPADTSVERLDRLDDDAHVMVFSLVGGDHGCRLANYQGVISAYEVATVSGTTKEIKTVVTEEYSVDVPRDSSEEDTRVFVDTLIGLNLKSLARVAESMMA